MPQAVRYLNPATLSAPTGYSHIAEVSGGRTIYIEKVERIVLTHDLMQNPNRRPNQLEERIIAFAASVVSLSSKLPRNPQGRHICDQILRSGSAVAANYGEARAAESRSDFIHKLKIVSKELNEATKRLSGSRSS